jgi:succinate dehydrogenase flavin-adding protein (antitoxin of CptAB toxin-antitoxin module)
MKKICSVAQVLWEQLLETITENELLPEYHKRLLAYRDHQRGCRECQYLFREYMAQHSAHERKSYRSNRAIME